VRPALVLLALALLAADAHGQCALCRESLRKSGDAGLIQGIYVSILMLTAAPAVLIAAIAFKIRRAYSRKMRESRSCA